MQHVTPDEAQLYQQMMNQFIIEGVVLWTGMIGVVILLFKINDMREAKKRAKSRKIRKREPWTMPFDRN